MTNASFSTCCVPAICFKYVLLMIITRLFPHGTPSTFVLLLGALPSYHVVYTPFTQCLSFLCLFVHAMNIIIGSYFIVVQVTP